MNLKKILIIVASFLVVVGLTVGVLIFVKGAKTEDNKNVESARGIQPSDDFDFGTISGIVALPTISQSPAESDGWSTTSSTEKTTFVNKVMTDTNGCTLTISSQQSVYSDETVKDYDFTKSFMNSLVQSEQGTVSEEYIIRVSSNQGDVYFYSGVYNPSYKLTSGVAGTAVKGYTTFIAARSITTPIATVSTTAAGGVLASYSNVPSMTIKYECPTDKFSADDALALIKQISFDFSSTNVITNTDAAGSK